MKNQTKETCNHGLLKSDCIACKDWNPIIKSSDIAVLGKTLEECGELSSALSRCLIQGLNEKEPSSGKPNREWLEEEVSDVLANINVLTRHFKLNTDTINRRLMIKEKKQLEWVENLLTRSKTILYEVGTFERYESGFHAFYRTTDKAKANEVLLKAIECVKELPKYENDSDIFKYYKSTDFIDDELKSLTKNDFNISSINKNIQTIELREVKLDY